jgi:hypothetical protein
MLNHFNPSSRESDKIERHCSNCNKPFVCDGSCENPKVLKMKDFCYCPVCWDKYFWKPHLHSYRLKCQILEKYLEDKGKGEDFKTF